MSFDEGSASPGPRIVLIGLGPTAASALEALQDRFAVVALVRGGDDEVVATARSRGIRVCADTHVAGVAELIGRIRPDCVVVSSYDRVLPGSLLRVCPFVNVHYAPLPRYRGRATVNWAIINGEPDAYLSIHCLTPELDSGGILHQQALPIGPRDTVGDLYARLNELQRAALGEAVTMRLKGYEGEPQADASATYACSRVPDDGEIDWGAPTKQIDRLVRALTDPFPGAYTFLGLEPLWIRRAAPAADAPRYEGRVPGRVVRVSPAGSSADVLTGDGTLRLFEVSRDDGPPVPASDVLRSVRQSLGLRKTDLVRRLVALERDMAYLRADGGGRQQADTGGSECAAVSF